MSYVSWQPDYHEPAGSDFESDMISALKDGLSQNEVYRITSMKGTILDKQQGTDFLCGKMRLDATMNFFDKDHMPFIAATGIPAIPGYNFFIGIRHGNSYKGYTGFQQPVVVIGVDMDPYTYGQHDNEIFASIKQNALKLMKSAKICLLDYLMQDPEQRKQLRYHPLRENPQYVEPKNLEAKYAAASTVHRKPIDVNAIKNISTFSKDYPFE